MIYGFRQNSKKLSSNHFQLRSFHDDVGDFPSTWPAKHMAKGAFDVGERRGLSRSFGMPTAFAMSSPCQNLAVWPLSVPRLTSNPGN